MSRPWRPWSRPDQRWSPPLCAELVVRAIRALKDWDNLGPVARTEKAQTTARRRDSATGADRFMPVDWKQACVRPWKDCAHLAKDTQTPEAGYAIGRGLCRVLVELGDHATAEKSIQRALKQQWSSTLVRQYGLLKVDDIPRQLAQAEGWLTGHPRRLAIALVPGPFIGPR